MLLMLVRQAKNVTEENLNPQNRNSLGNTLANYAVHVVPVIPVLI